MALRLTPSQKEHYTSVYNAMSKWKRKFMTVYDLSQVLGIVEDVLRDELATFDPIIRIMPDYDILPLKLTLQELLFGKRPLGTTKKRKVVEVPYKTVAEFVTKEMTIPGGMIDRSRKLTEKQLKTLRTVLNYELKHIKK